MGFGKAMVAAIFFAVGVTFFVGGVTGARWIVDVDTDWWAMDTRKALKKFVGVRGARWFFAVVGLAMMGLTAAGVIIALSRRP